MNFTREPIIETIITPKEGYKLLVKSSKASAQEEYLVDSLEVVSFGHSFFFRCLERPKCFLVPASDFEISEVKETRVALKAVSYDRAIKIGGGREAPMRTHREPEREESSDEPEESPTGEPTAEPLRMDRKRDRRRHRRRRPDDRDWSDNRPRHENEKNATEGTSSSESAEQGGNADDDTQVEATLFRALIPPPTTLISETISRYKEFVITEEPSKEAGPSAPSDDEAPSGYNQRPRIASSPTLYTEKDSPTLSQPEDPSGPRFSS